MTDKPANDNPSALTQALRGVLARNQDELASNLAEALRSSAEGQAAVAEDAIADAGTNLRHIISVAKHLGEHDADES